MWPGKRDRDRHAADNRTLRGRARGANEWQRAVDVVVRGNQWPTKCVVLGAVRQRRTMKPDLPICCVFCATGWRGHSRQKIKAAIR
jgi:hypothetical protein